MNDRGEWCTDIHSLAAMTIDFFGNIYSSSKPSVRNIEAVTECCDCIVGEQMNTVLCAPFSEDEIRKAVFDMHPSKAPGPDGFTALFYQKLWPIIGKDITKAALEILNDKKKVA